MISHLQGVRSISAFAKFRTSNPGASASLQTIDAICSFFNQTKAVAQPYSTTKAESEGDTRLCCWDVKWSCVTNYGTSFYHSYPKHRIVTRWLVVFEHPSVLRARFLFHTKHLTMDTNILNKNNNNVPIKQYFPICCITGKQTHRGFLYLETRHLELIEVLLKARAAC